MFLKFRHLRNGRMVRALFASLCLTLFLLDSSAQYTNIANGILIEKDGQQIELSVAGSSSFRLRIANSDTAQSIESTFIDTTASETAGFSVVEDGASYGIAAGFGKLMFNTESASWSLFDADGNTLISNGTYSSSSSAQAISYKIAPTGKLYGSGNNSTKELLKTQSNAQIGNGIVDIPYLWSSEGYSILGVTPDDNSPASWVKKDSMVNWAFTGESADIYLWPAKTMYDAMQGYINVTGKPKVPPKWAFGYLQCRWGWADRAYIENALDSFRSRDLPVDAFIYDFEWYTPFPDYFLSEDGLSGYHDFEFNSSLFPEPELQIAEYKSRGVKSIGIRKPRLGDSDNLAFARENGWLVNSGYNNRDMDFSNPDLQAWYRANSKHLLEKGMEAWWNDEGEAYYSCYYWWNKTEADMLEEVRPNSRHLGINRAFSPGAQRLGYVTWNGDITSKWQDLVNTTGDLTNWSLAGMYYGTCDIGGFGTTDPPKEIVVRWFQAGVFFPIMRAHSNVGATPRFPWLWGEDGEAAIKKALNLRYRLLPYTYSLGHEAYRTGAPIMRPLVMEFPDDPNVENLSNEWLLGKGVLAAPIMNSGGSRSIYLPDDTWYDFFTNEVIQGGRTITVNKALDEFPVFVRAGTILPIGPVMQYTEQDTTDTLEIRIYPGHDAEFTLTEDDGLSYNYTDAQVRMTTFSWDDASNTLSWEVSGTFNDTSIYKSIKVVVGKQVKTATIGSSGSLTFDDFHIALFDPLPGIFSTGQSVSILAETGDAIYYTTDGSEPTTASDNYAGPIPVGIGEDITIKAMAVQNTIEGPVTTGRYTVLEDCPAEGRITLEKWTGLNSSMAVSSIPITKVPSSTSYLTEAFEIPSNTGLRYYGVRIRGLLRAPISGTYTFYIAGDDNVELWLSTDSTAANKRKIAYHNDWTDPYEWSKYAEQMSDPIVLESCNDYYIDALMKQSGGGDNLAVRWLTPMGTDEVIPGRYLSSIVLNDYDTTTTGTFDADFFSETDNNTFDIYPNPANEKVYIAPRLQIDGEINITIYNLQGSVVYTTTEQSSALLGIDISKLEAGLYLLYLRTEDLSYTGKFSRSR